MDSLFSFVVALRILHLIDTCLFLALQPKTFIIHQRALYLYSCSEVQICRAMELRRDSAMHEVECLDLATLQQVQSLELKIS